MNSIQVGIITEFGDDISCLVDEIIELRNGKEELEEDLEKANDRIVELEQEIKDITN